MKNNLKLITQLTRGRARHDDVGWNLNLSRIRNLLFHIFIVSKKWYSQDMNNTSTCPDTDSDFLKCAKPKSREFIRDRELAFLQTLLQGHGRFQNFNLHRGNLGSPSFTTNSLYLSCTSHSSRNLQSPWAGMSNRWKGTLAKRTKLKNIS